MRNLFESGVLYDSFAISEVRPDGTMVGTNVDGEEREFALVVNRRTDNDELEIGVARRNWFE